MNSTSDSDDVSCVRRTLNGETEAFDELVVRYQKMVYNAAYQIVRNREDALELSQSVFLKVFRNLASFDPDRRFFSWLYRITLNDSLSFLESRRLEEPFPRGLPSDRIDPEGEFEASEARRHIETLLGELPPEQRAAIVVRHVMGCSYDQAAEILGIPVKTFKSRLYEARQTLRARLSALGYGPRRLAHAGRQGH